MRTIISLMHLDGTEPVWNAIERISRNEAPNPLSNCIKLIQLTQKFQWW